MIRVRAWIRSFFGFSRTETNAFLVLLPLMFVLIFAEPAYRYWFVRQPHDFSKEQKELDSLVTTWRWEERDSAAGPAAAKKLFDFNPNLATLEDLLALDIHPSVANRIIHYRTKGGKFAIKKDLKKIYGMDSLLYNRLAPFIDLPEKIERATIEKKPERKEKPIARKFDLNMADTAQLITIYGIGSKLSRRIVLYREKLGGFISVAQLKEVYGLDTAVIHELVKKSFIAENFAPRLIEINSATEKELAYHPYLNYKLAKAIAAYRFQHGKYRTVDEIRKIAIMDETRFQKIKPYLSANQ